MTECQNIVGRQPYEPFVFARRHAISIDTARAIIKLHGTNREASDAAAEVTGPTQQPVELDDWHIRRPGPDHIADRGGPANDRRRR